MLPFPSGSTFYYMVHKKQKPTFDRDFSKALAYFWPDFLAHCTDMLDNHLLRVSMFSDQGHKVSCVGRIPERVNCTPLKYAEKTCLEASRLSLLKIHFYRSNCT